MKFGVVIFPTSEIQNLANDFRKRYDPHYALIPPHITVKDKFEVEESKIPEIVQAINEVTKEAQPFTLEVYKINNFHPNSNTIYLAIRAEPSLIHLHEKLHQSPLNHEQAFIFIPHITIGQNMSNDELHDIFSRLQRRKFSLTFEVDRVHLIYQLDNSSWSVYETFLLGE